MAWGAPENRGLPGPPGRLLEERSTQLGWQPSVWMAAFSLGPLASIHQLPQFSEMPSLTKLTMKDSIPQRSNVFPYWAWQGSAAPGYNAKSISQQAGGGFWPPERAASLTGPDLQEEVAVQLGSLAGCPRTNGNVASEVTAET